MITGDAHEGGREAVSRDAAEAECIHVVSHRREGREDEPPVGSHDDEATEDAHSVAALVERAADLVEPIKPKLRGREPQPNWVGIPLF